MKVKNTTGLSSDEAQNLLTQHGSNEIVAQSRQTPLAIFVSQFKSLLIILLMTAAAASLFLGDLIDGIFILLIVVLNGILGFVQEYKAEKAITALKKMTIATVRVIRDGVEQKIDSKLLVPGDVIILEEGDKIPADCTLIESIHLEANEASLTGESLPVEKDHNDENENHVYLGTIVAKGRGKAIVIATGMQTRFGKIATSLSEIRKEETPLQKKLDILGKQLGFLALFASGIVFVIGIIAKNPLIEMILTSISLAVAAVPEGLPAVITITLAIGMQRMARKKAILRSLSAIESLGSATVIATDKTGTLTRNEMRVATIWIDNISLPYNDQSLTASQPLFEKLLTAGVLCNNARLGESGILGDTTEGALILLANDKGIDINVMKQRGELVEEFAFDPIIKLMTVVWNDVKGIHVYAKGAPESILDRCSFVLGKQGAQKITPTIRDEAKKAFEEFAKKGLRVLALAYQDTNVIPKRREEAEQNLIMIGLVGIADPPREEVAAAIGIAKQAGIRTIMITGDNELTAHAIGAHIGLIAKGEEIITGKQFALLSDEVALERLNTISIFARTTPDQKLRIVQLLQKMGHTVAVTGDGVNDALALKQADVGVAMGITGTDVAKEAADMIITDDNYASLVVAVEEGRTIFDNIKSAIRYLVGCNIGEVAAVVGGIFMGWPLILTPLQLLYINLITDGLPAIALSVTPKHDSVMTRPPRKQKNIFDTHDKKWLVEVSLLTAGIALIAFYIGNAQGGLVVGRAMVFTTIVLSQSFILLDTWAKNASAFQKKIFTDKIFLGAFIAPFILQLLVLYVPLFSGVFKITAISVPQFVYAIALSSILLVASEIRKRALI